MMLRYLALPSPLLRFGRLGRAAHDDRGLAGDGPAQRRRVLHAGLDEFDRTVKMTPEGQLDCCYTFGGVVDKNEHCNIFVYYYPKSENVGCF